MIDFNSIAGALVSAITGGGFGWMLRSNRRKANAEAEAAEIDSLHLAMEQIKDLQKEMADNAEKLRQLNEALLLSNEQRHQLEMQLLTTRCDRIGCTGRRPPLPWLTETDTPTETHPS